ncbi:MAG: PAS domain-containing protein [Candidatus Angelobacter sp.]
MNPAPHSQATILLCGDQYDSVLALQSEIFRGTGHSVVPVASVKEIQERIESSAFDIVVLNHTLSFSDRKKLARKAKNHRGDSAVLALHHSGALDNPHVDLAVDSRAGAQAMLQALRRVEAMLHARSRHYAGFDGDYMAVVDADRNYTFVSDPVCDLLGYDRAMFLELRIDDVVDGSTQVTAPLFQDFVASGEQAGTISLRHRSGKCVPVKYWSRVQPDGCMIARWEPIQPD